MMLLPQIVEKFANLVFKNQKYSNDYLKVFAGGLFGSVEEDSLKTDLEALLGKEISSTDYEQWKNTNKNLLNNLTNRSWFDFNPNSIAFSQDSVNKWVITQNVKELKDYYEDPEISEDFDIKQSSLLQGYGSIPILYLVRGTLEASFIISEPEQESSELAHNFFIVQALKLFFEDITTQEINQFLLDNKPTIDKLKSGFQQIPSMLGKGADGIVFSIGPNLVLKIFRTKLGYDKAREAQERLWKNPRAARTEAMIYDAGVLGSIRENPLYYYLIQKMKPVRELSPSDKDVSQAEVTITRIIKLVSEFFVDNEADVFSPLKAAFKKNPNMQQLNRTIKSIAKNLSLEIVDYLGASDIEEVSDTIKEKFSIELKEDWLFRFVEEIIIKYLTDRADLHIGNVGTTSDGYLRYFDPAHPAMPTPQDYLEYFEAELTPHSP